MNWLEPFTLDWQDAYNMAVTGAVLYAYIVVVVHLFGIRSMAQFNNFDWIVTVAIGSIIASGIILENVTIFEAVLATTILFVLQWMITYATVHWKWAAKIAKVDPITLLEDGELKHDVMLRERVAESEVKSVIREAGYRDFGEIELVTLETDATASVVPKSEESTTEQKRR